MPFGNLFRGIAKGARGVFRALSPVERGIATRAATYGLAGAYFVVPAIEGATGEQLTGLDEQIRDGVRAGYRAVTTGASQAAGEVAASAAKGVTQGAAAGFFGLDLDDPATQQIAGLALGLVAVLFALSLMGKR